jgi:hypothetical protein
MLGRQPSDITPPLSALGLHPVATATRMEHSGAMMSSPAREAAFDLAAVLGSVKQGTLRMFGDWFGRPWDNVHIVRTVRADKRDLIVGFGEDEELAISDPAGWSFDAETFRVSEASRVAAVVLLRAAPAAG